MDRKRWGRHGDAIHILAVAALRRPSRAPTMHVIEEEDVVVLCCDVPEAAREDIKVDVAPRSILIEVKRARPWLTFPPPSVAYGGFRRAIPLLSEVRPETRSVTLTNGVLEIVVQRAMMGDPRAYSLPDA